MAIFSNQATLTYNGNSTNSNIAYGEILEVLSATKTAVEPSYTLGNLITYVVTLRNTGSTPLTGLTLTDNLGEYALDSGTAYPLAYEAGSVLYFAGGVLQPAPTVTAGPPLIISGIQVPANNNAAIIYQTRVSETASPDAAGTITNTVTVTGSGTTPVTATETVSALVAPQLTITKSITPAQVTENSRVTYTFLIQNTGNTPIVATDDAVITDTFDPILTDLVVSFNGAVWTEGTDYTYNEATGLFATLPSRITVPAATYTQNPVTGEYTTTPGTATLVVTGTI